jgi:hypothetical protein
MKNLDSCRRWRCMLCPCNVRHKFFIHFWNRTILLCMPCICIVGHWLWSNLAKFSSQIWPQDVESSWWWRHTSGLSAQFDIITSTNAAITQTLHWAQNVRFAAPHTVPVQSTIFRSDKYPASYHTHTNTCEAPRKLPSLRSDFNRNLINNFIEPLYLPPCNSPWEANSSIASQEITHILLNSKIHYHIHNSPPLTPTLSQINPLHFLRTYF